MTTKDSAGNGAPPGLYATFDQAVYLIAAGLDERERLFSASPGSYPYSATLRHGIAMLAALVAQHAPERAAELLPRLSESEFIRTWASRDVASWTDGWPEDVREQLARGGTFGIGPLAEPDGDYLCVSDACTELLFNAESDLLGGFQERQAYEYLISGIQEQYAFGRRLLIRNPVLGPDDLMEIKAGTYDHGSDLLDQGESRRVDVAWTEELVNLSYEPVPPGSQAWVCPSCGWTVTKQGLQARCARPACGRSIPSDVTELEPVKAGSHRLKAGIMRYIALPGKLELEIAEHVAGIGLPFELWPKKDTCDLCVRLPDGKALAIDAKAYGSPESLARAVAHDSALARLDAAELLYVVPDEAEREHPGFCATCDAALEGRRGYGCLTFGQLRRRLAREMGA